MSDNESVLEYALELRKKLISSMTEEGMPVDAKDRHTLLAALDGMERTALSRMRIASQEKIAGDDREAASFILNVLKGLPSGNPYKAETPVERNEQWNVDEHADGVLETVDGETEIGLVTETFNEFIQRMENQ